MEIIKPRKQLIGKEFDIEAVDIFVLFDNSLQTGAMTRGDIP
jgi:hypothetical protein